MSAADLRTKDAVFVFIEQTDGAVEDVSLQVLGKGREIADRLGTQLVAFLLGDEVGGAAEECASRGADVVLLADAAPLNEFTTEAYVKAMAPVLREHDPAALLVGATHNGTALASSLAVNLGAGLMAHVVDLEIEEGTRSLLGSVPGFGGSIVAVCKCRKGRPQIATVRPGVFREAERKGARGRIVTVTASVAPEDVKVKVVEKRVGKSPEIGRAETVVVAGLGCKADLSVPLRLAEALNGTMAVSRPLADKGLAAKELVVGSTGTGLSAKKAVVLGVSGAAHFTSGIREVGTVIAINLDPSAQIFKHADYCVVGDASKLVPKLLEELAVLGGEKAP